KANISTTFYRIKKEEEGNRRNKKEITTKFDEEPDEQTIFYYIIEKRSFCELLLNRPVFSGGRKLLCFGATSVKRDDRSSF
ncbi:hypothetical protein, partial [Bacteroides sp.]|uniref:hypothetical protein n=1 Tax=Bacteroides sp. TaxID=29523 RepID=UPI0025884C60